ncbi:MAG: redoxin domain-containing protein [Deltaproteobacteria bacterium]|nr:redoxin domain-containing protein [Deltaproteobacteria bacterium]
MHAKPILWLALILSAGFVVFYYSVGGVSDRSELLTADVIAPDGEFSAAAEPTLSPTPSPSPTESRANDARPLGLADSSSDTAIPVAKRHPSERPLQAFSGTGLDGERLTISQFIGKRLTLFFFNPEVDEADFTADAVSRIAKFTASNNFNLVGVALGSTRSKAKEFAKEKGFDFPVFDDSTGRIAGQLGLRNPVGIYGFDDEGYLDFGIGYFAKEVPDPAGVVEDQLRENLRLPARERGTAGVLDTRPQAPMFSANLLDKSEAFDLASLSGKPTVLIFFLHTCPHCHAALDFLKEQLAKFPADKRPEIVAVSAANRPSAVRVMLKERGLEAMRVVLDTDGDLMEQYGVFGGFPDIFLIDRSGKIVHRTQGWREDRDPALNRMMLSKIAGTRIPMLLNPRGYTGSDVCSVCHEAEAQTVRFTQHADAFNTIVTHNETRNAECVSCHVVGFGEPGGYSFDESPKQLENVGCESCHGRGGPHLSPDFVPASSKTPKDATDTKSAKNYESICQTCHNATHSISFDYETFRPRISHRKIASLTNAQRVALIGDAAKPRDVLPKNADYVGSNACQSCHPSEFQTWADSPHSRATDTLESKGKADDAGCLKCHTTGMGRAGGFPKDGKGADPGLEDLASVGCESCHGPGGNHIAPSAKKLGTIVSLADKCDSCAILQICGSCHDEANDAGFEFEVDEKVELQRHGTIEAGTGKPLPPKPTAGRSREGRFVQDDVARAFRWLEIDG